MSIVIKRMKALMLPVCLLVSATAVSAEDGTITFTGDIRDATCVVTVGDDTGSSDTGDFTVKLKPVSVTALDADKRRAGDTPFYIKLSGAQCPNGKYANVSFERALSLNIDPVTGNLKNHTAAGAASKVQVGLTDEKLNAIDLNQQITDPTAGKQIANNTAQFDYWAQYVATGGAATAGSVNTNVVYSIIYN
ncbi:type 1 fimbrial protein [Chimaeribacter californicus]|uniref:Type 1 fimbrial protein n=1 Tax=Chimaeribacter californicus TaxID=2060067 RepID=A0A2N5E581_9GAMM|nr:fimbrial protein [Chimaeribacter californicus]PLR36282.1 type 1 fimbrial protein [Chimaeribacter californicus]